MWPLSPALSRRPMEETLLQALWSPRSCTALLGLGFHLQAPFLLLPHGEQTGQKEVWGG